MLSDVEFLQNYQFSRIIEFCQTCWENHETKNMLIFLSINFLFMFIELAYGVYSNSLGLISDAFHMLSDCMSLLVALFAAYVALKHSANDVYTYGYARA